jgi:hypothetical protein
MIKTGFALFYCTRAKRTCRGLAIHVQAGPWKVEDPYSTDPSEECTGNTQVVLRALLLSILVNHIALCILAVGVSPARRSCG